MEVVFSGKKIEQLEFRNQMSPAKLQLQVKINISVSKPDHLTLNSRIVIRHLMMFGSPIDPFYLLMNHVTIYQIADLSDQDGTTIEEQTKTLNELCVPLAVDQVNESLAAVCKSLSISPLRLQTSQQMLS